MKKEIGGAEIELEPNSRPYLLKRMLADGFDIVVIFALFMLFTMLIMKIPLSNTYHMHYEKCLAIQKETAVQFQNDAEICALFDPKKAQKNTFGTRMIRFLYALV